MPHERATKLSPFQEFVCAMVKLRTDAPNKLLGYYFVVSQIVFKSGCDFGLLRNFVERPSNLQARAMTWSNYKHHNTIKVLLGITPQEVVSFVSESSYYQKR